jgi:hypothetical protein
MSPRLRILAASVLLPLAAAAQQRPPVSIDFENYLRQAGLHEVLPVAQLYRTASEWQRCGGPQYEVPPRSHWPQVKRVLALLVELKRRGIIGEVQAVSAYRNPRLNKCAGGAPRSSHTRTFAIDIVGTAADIDERALCGFWRVEGKAWDMGLSRYPSGRIHLDTSGWRTWGADHSRRTAICAR